MMENVTLEILKYFDAQKKSWYAIFSIFPLYNFCIKQFVIRRII